MATIITAEKGLILTSGLKFCTLSTINGGTKNAELVSTDETVEIQNIPNPLPRQDIQEVPQPIKENLRILCSAFSSSEKYVAFADDHKQLSLWEWQDNAGLKLIKQWNLMRRANKIIFDHCRRNDHPDRGDHFYDPDDEHILIADKSGDVFRFSKYEDEGKCVLGHLSMLLDLKLSRDGNFIITCDRDEKIRVSHYPNAYNIHNYCLGHTDFVSCLEIPMPFSGEYLISGSGDSTIRIWDYLKGKELVKVNCAQDAGLEPIEIEETPETDLIIKRSPYPAVLSLRCNLQWLLGVTMENYKGVLIYKYSDELGVPPVGLPVPPGKYKKGPKLKLVVKIQLDHFVWDLHYLTPYPSFPWMPQKIVILQASKEKPILMFKVNCDPHREDLNFQENVEVNLDQDFFRDALVTPDSSSAFAKELHKRLIDNVKEYMEKKRERIDVSDNAKKLKSL